MAAPSSAQDADYAGRLIVLNRASDQVSILQLPTGEVIKTITTDKGPHEVGLSPDGKWAVVSNYGAYAFGKERAGKSLSVINLEKLELDRVIKLEAAAQPHGIQFAADGRSIWLTAEALKQVWQMSFPEGEVLKRIPIGQELSHMLEIGPEGRTYVSNRLSGSVSILDAGAEKPSKILKTGREPEGLALTKDGKQLWVCHRGQNDFVVIDTEKDKVIHRERCAGFPVRIEFTPDQKLALISCSMAGEVAIYDTKHFEIQGRINMRLRANLEGTGQEGENKIGISPVPVGIAFHPNNRYAFVANSGADRIAVLDLEYFEVVGLIRSGGKEPYGVAFLEPATQ